MGEITKLAVFDFDGTLIDTPLPEFGKQEYKDKTGEEWPHAGWWGQPLSLDSEIFDINIIPSVIRAYLKEINEPHNFLRGLVSYIGFKHTFVEYVREERYLEKSKYNRYI